MSLDRASKQFDQDRDNSITLRRQLQLVSSSNSGVAASPYTRTAEALFRSGVPMSSADSLVKTELPSPVEAKQKDNDADGERIPQGVQQCSGLR